MVRHPLRISVSGSVVAAAVVAGMSGAASAQTSDDVVLETGLLSNIQHDLDTIPVDFVIKPGTYAASNITVNYDVYDLYKNPIGQGTFDLSLIDGQEARHGFSFTPPENGWYTVETQVFSGGQNLAGRGINIGVTPSFTGLPDIGPRGHFINDERRMAFSGLRIDRVDTSFSADPMAHVNATLTEANQYGVNLFVQFVDQAHATDLNHITEWVTEFQGRVKYWEVWNEPNVSAATYVNVLKNAYQTIKAIDPEAKVIGPTRVNMGLAWYEDFFEAGGGQYADIISVHDYEGNEAVDPGHWRWKYGALRDMMVDHGVGDKEIWQTERAIGGVRGGLFIGGVQAVRVGLHRDLLASMGTPSEHNHHFYLNQHGYSSVPTYLWSNAGPNPAVLTLRTRDAMIQNRTFTHTLDFGPTGDKIYFALNYDGPDGSTIILRNYGTLDRPVALNVSGGPTVTVTDSFGNEQLLNVINGRVNVMTSGLPVYVRLAPGQQATALPIDFGENIASQASFSFSGNTSSNSALLNNGIFEAAHPSNPNNTYWTGALGGQSQTLTITFDDKEYIDKAIIYSVRADNPHSALLDYDLEYWDGETWVLLEEVRTPLGETDAVVTHYDAHANTWYMDTNFFVHEFDPIYTDQLRLVALRVTHGFHPDAIAADLANWTANSNPPLTLREIEIYRAAIPEPASLALFTAGSLVMFRRRRKDGEAA